MKKLFYLITIIIFSLSCKQKDNETEFVLINNETEHILPEKDSLQCKIQIKNGVEFETCISPYDFFILKSSTGELIYKNSNQPYDFTYTDFNEDGYYDIELHFMTNVPDVNEILLFKPTSNSFIEIENFSNFPASKKIRGSKYYYSYHRSGCADLNWDSDLYYIENNIAVKIGNINAIECDDSNERGIYIYKISRDMKKQIEFIPTEKKDFDNKWEFIEKYWTNNFMNFE